MTFPAAQRTLEAAGLTPSRDCGGDCSESVAGWSVDREFERRSPCDGYAWTGGRGEAI